MQFGRKNSNEISDDGIEMIQIAIYEAVMSQSISDLDKQLGPNSLNKLEKYHTLSELRLFKMFSWTYSIGLNRAKLSSNSAQLLTNKVTELLIAQGIYTLDEFQEIRNLHGPKDKLLTLVDFNGLQESLSTRYFEYAKIISSASKNRDQAFYMLGQQVARNCNPLNMMTIVLFASRYFSEALSGAPQMVNLSLKVR